MDRREGGDQEEEERCGSGPRELQIDRGEEGGKEE